MFEQVIAVVKGGQSGSPLCKGWGATVRGPDMPAKNLKGTWEKAEEIKGEDALSKGK